MRVTSSLFLLIAATALVVGARGEQAPRADTRPPSSTRPPSERFERDMMVRFHMHQNFDLLRAIERLLIRGKLEDAQRFATAIAEVPGAPAHGPWATNVVLVLDRAGAFARAKTIEEAFAREAELAAACGGCHVDTSVVPQFRAHPSAPADLSTTEARMARHRWAADRLWEGIVGAADEPWKAGLEVLAAAPLEWSGKERIALARALQRQANAARKRTGVDSLDSRAAAYGQMLSTCAACHTLTPATAKKRTK